MQEIDTNSQEWLTPVKSVKRLEDGSMDLLKAHIAEIKIAHATAQEGATLLQAVWNS